MHEILLKCNLTLFSKSLSGSLSVKILHLLTTVLAPLANYHLSVLRSSPLIITEGLRLQSGEEDSTR